MGTVLYRVTYTDATNATVFLLRYSEGVSALLLHIEDTAGLDLVSVTKG